MNCLPDYHMHTWLCRHAEGEPSSYAAQAIRLGLTEIGFSDHAPMPEADFDNWRMHPSQLEEYLEAIRRAQQDHPGLRIRTALEIDFIPGYQDWIEELRARHPWDYLIGSVHYISPGWDVDNPEKKAQWHGRDPWEVWTMYFERLILAAESGLFDILGHADLPKKFGIYPRQDCLPLFGGLVQAARRGKVVLELNTAGLRKDCAEIYPCPSLLGLAHEAGVPITFGSDAHLPTEVGLNFAEALALARACGYRDYCRFSRRQREIVPLPLTC